MHITHALYYMEIIEARYVVESDNLFEFYLGSS